MSMHFRALAEQAMADGAISAEDILALRQGAWSNGAIDLEEVEALFTANDHLKEPSAEWTEFFAEALSEFLVNGAEPAGYVSEEHAEMLIERIDQDGRVETRAELELIARLFDKAVSVPQILRDYGLKQIENAVITGEGPLQDGALTGNGINADECRLLRRFIFAAGGDRPAAVSRAEAEALFRIKDATLYETNAAEWEQLFVQGVGNYLLGFGGNEPLSAQRAAELENFMNSDGAGIGGFLSRMLHADVEESFGSLLTVAPAVLEIGADEEDETDIPEVDAAEEVWLHDHLDADEDLDPLEKALLAFIAEETGEAVIAV